MNKSEFLNRLDKALGGMNWEEKKEVIYDYEEYFANAVAEGKTEEQAAEELGNPEEIALNYFQGEKGAESNETKSSGKQLFSKIFKKLEDFASNINFDGLSGAFIREKMDVDLAIDSEISTAEKLEVLYCKSTDVKIIRTQEKMFRAELKGVAKTNPEFPLKLEYKYNGENQTIGFFINWQNQKSASLNGLMTIFVPENFTGDVRVETISGNLLELPENLSSLNFKSVSGEILNKNVLLKNDLILRTVSGGCKSEEVSCHNLVFNSVSGDFKAQNTKISVIKFESTSGDIKTCFLNQPEELKFKTVSGDVNVKLQGKSAIKVLFKSVSGDMKTDFSFPEDSVKRKFGSVKVDCQCSGEGLFKIEGKTVSGDLKIKKMESANE